MILADPEVLVQQGGGHAKSGQVRRRFLPASGYGSLRMTVLDKLRSSRQGYRLTLTGSEYLKRIGDDR